jgi:hypothetical protein
MSILEMCREEGFKKKQQHLLSGLKDKDMQAGIYAILA